MKNLKIFVLENCPYCKKALSYLKTYDLSMIDVEIIEERRNSDIANSYDYYYVPSFFLNEKKIHEGAISEDEMAKLVEIIKG